MRTARSRGVKNPKFAATWYEKYISGRAGTSRVSWRISPTMPTIVIQGVDDEASPSLKRLPIASSAGQYSLAMVWLMSAAGGESGPSLSRMLRPAINRAPIVRR